MIITFVPAGLERMFLEVGKPLAPGQSPAPPTRDDIDRLLAAAPKYGIELRLPG